MVPVHPLSIRFVYHNQFEAPTTPAASSAWGPSCHCGTLGAAADSRHLLRACCRLNRAEVTRCARVCGRWTSPWKPVTFGSSTSIFASAGACDSPCPSILWWRPACLLRLLKLDNRSIATSPLQATDTTPGRPQVHVCRFEQQAGACW